MKGFFLVVALVLTGGQCVSAQTFSSLYDLTASSDGTNSDGIAPSGTLVVASKVLYGITALGGNDGLGTVFKLNTDGSGFTVLHSFEAGDPRGFNYDGSQPVTGLILSGETLYGEALIGGNTAVGTIFTLNTNGTDFQVLYSFNGQSDGGLPHGGLVLDGNTLYGTTTTGGHIQPGDNPQTGTLFALPTDGSQIHILHTFPALTGAGTNTDGATPTGVILSGNILYGATRTGGGWGGGTLFSLNTSGFGFKVLHNFVPLPDGANPAAPLTLIGNTLYGTTTAGGAFGGGTIFKINADGGGFTNLHDFPIEFGADAAPPTALASYGTVLFGTTVGTVFRVNSDGSGFSTLHRFSPLLGPTQTNLDGASPVGGVVFSDAALYGTTGAGGIWGNGTVFSVYLPSLAPTLAVLPSGTNLVLQWPTNFPSFSVESAVDLRSRWTPFNGPDAVIVTNGQYVLSVPLSTLGDRQFFRLSK